MIHGSSLRLLQSIAASFGVWGYRNRFLWFMVNVVPRQVKKKIQPLLVYSILIFWGSRISHANHADILVSICNNNLIPGNSTQCKPLYLSDDPPCVAPRLCGGFACGNREHGQNRSIHSHIHHIHHMQQHIHRHTHTHLETTQYPRSTFLRQALLRVQKL